MSGVIEAARWFKRAERGLYAGRTRLTGNHVSPSKHCVKRAWLPNVQRKRLWSDSLNRFIDINVTTAALRDIDRAGGVDNYLLKSEITTETANRLRRLILKAQKSSETHTPTNVAPISSNTSVAAAELR